MSTTTQSGFLQWRPGSQAHARTGPERQPRPAPILINDAAVPWAGSTTLLEILRADRRDAKDQTPEP